METQLRQQIEQRHRAEADLMAVRDLCVKLDQQKDTLVDQLGDKDTVKVHVNLLTLHSIHLFFILLLFYFLHVTLVSPSLYFFIQYEAQLSRLKAEQSIVQDQITRDRVTIERLEILLDQSRQESINAQATSQELQNELCRLKQKVSELQNKLYVPIIFMLYLAPLHFRYDYSSSESAELRQYQNQAAEYSKQISELRRQVTNERFDRARKEEESRRYFIVTAKNVRPQIYLFTVESFVYALSCVLSHVIHRDRFPI